MNTEGFDVEDIPFVYSDSLEPAPSEEEIAVIAATLAHIFPALPKPRTWEALARMELLRSGGGR